MCFLITVVGIVTINLKFQRSPILKEKYLCEMKYLMCVKCKSSGIIEKKKKKNRMSLNKNQRKNIKRCFREKNYLYNSARLKKIIYTQLLILRNLLRAFLLFWFSINK